MRCADSRVDCLAGAVLMQRAAQDWLQQSGRRILNGTHVTGPQPTWMDMRARTEHASVRTKSSVAQTETGRSVIKEHFIIIIFRKNL